MINNSYFSNSAKTIDDSNFNKSNKKKILKNISQINTNNLYYKKNNSSSNIFLEKTPFTSLAKNYVNINNIYNRFTPSCLRKNKRYGNFFIFGKRDIIFKKIINKGKKVFKYNQSLIEGQKRNSNKINSLYLTESLNKTCKNKKTKLPLLDKDKSINEEKSNIINLYTNKNINKDTLLLKKIVLNKKKENDILKKKEFYEHKDLLKKQNILSKSALDVKSINNYIKDFKDILIDKYNLNIKNEKLKVVKENINNKLGKIKDDLNDLEINSKLFLDEFYPKLIEYVKFFEAQRELEHQRNLSYINKIYLLQKIITGIKNKIVKCQIEKEHLLKEIFLRICVKEKKLNLPNYYKDILLNNFTLTKVREKYGNNFKKEEFKRVLEYKNSTDINEMDTIFDKLNILTNNNIELLNSYNKSQNNILALKKYEKKVEQEINNDGLKEIDDLIIEKEKILKNNIKKNIILEKEVSNLFKEIPIKQRNKKKSKLFLKVELLLKNLDENLNYELDIDNRIKGEITEEKIIIQMIRRIEIIITIFLEKFKKNRILYPDKEKYFKSLFDKEKKIKKTIEQKRNIIIKFENEKKKIFEKYNKILFLQNRKIYIKKPNKKISFDKDLTDLEEKGDKINDFLYDI